MNEEQLQVEGARFIAKWQPRLRLLDWDIQMEVGACEADHGAESTILWRDHLASVRVAPDFPAAIRSQHPHGPLKGVPDLVLLEECVVHELLHVSEFPLADAMNDEIAWLVGKSDGVLGSTLRNTWRDYREWWINQQTRVLLAAEEGRWQ